MTLEELHSHLNRPEIVDRFAFRAPDLRYELVSSINSCIAAYLAENEPMVAVFLYRARLKWIDLSTVGLPPLQRLKNTAYLQMVDDYIRKMTAVMNDRGFGVPSAFEDILLPQDR